MSDTQTTHFFHFDERFCGDRTQGRQVTTDEAKVTCGICESNAKFVADEWPEVIEEVK